MDRFRQPAGIVLALSAALLVFLAPIEGLSREGKACLAFTLMAVIMWMFRAAQSGYIAALFLMLLVIFQVAPLQDVFSVWHAPSIYLVIGAYLMADAVSSSGLGERIAYRVISRYLGSFKSIIICIFLLNFILGFLVPHSWPRALLILAVMKVMIKSAGIEKKDAAAIGFAVFAASVPTSMIMLTGDTTISPLVMEASGTPLGYLDWLKVMGVPAIALSALNCVLILLLFKPSKPIRIDREQILGFQRAIGPMKKSERITLIWLLIAVALWVSDTVHGIHIGWVTLLVAVMMSMPVVGGVVTADSWKNVPLHVLLFLTAAVAIGRVGTETGMTEWLARVVLPQNLPANPFLMAAVVVFISMAAHLLLGSVVGVMGVLTPAMVAACSKMGFAPLVPALLVYTAVAGHYILPFHHLNILVGAGGENGMYGSAEAARMGLLLIPAVFITALLIELPWWKLIGLI